MMGGSIAIENRGGEPGIAGADAAGLSQEFFVLCGRAKSWGPPSDGSALRGAGAGLWAAGGHRGSTAAGQRTGHHAGGQSLVGVAVVRQGQGARLTDPKLVHCQYYCEDEIISRIAELIAAPIGSSKRVGLVSHFRHTHDLITKKPTHDTRIEGMPGITFFGFDGSVGQAANMVHPK